MQLRSPKLIAMDSLFHGILGMPHDEDIYIFIASIQFTNVALKNLQFSECSTFLWLLNFHLLGYEVSTVFQCQNCTVEDSLYFTTCPYGTERRDAKILAASLELVLDKTNFERSFFYCKSGVQKANIHGCTFSDYFGTYVHVFAPLSANFGLARTLTR